MSFNLQPVLENDKVILYPLKEEDFEALYLVASDPAIWEQHPNKDRWKRDVFRTFFEGALLSNGAFKVIDKATGNIAGSTRIYDYSQEADSVLIGYTFYATQFWGHRYEPVGKSPLIGLPFPIRVTGIFPHRGEQHPLPGSHMPPGRPKDG